MTKDYAQASRAEFIAANSKPLTHEDKLRIAAERHDKPFKCAARFLPREILVEPAQFQPPTFRKVMP